MISNLEIFGSLLAPILKLNIGFVQCWILVELGLKVTLNIKQTESLQKSVSGVGDLGLSLSQSEGKSSQRINKWIKYGRCVLIVVTIVELTLLFAYFGYQTVEL